MFPALLLVDLPFRKTPVRFPCLVAKPVVETRFAGNRSTLNPKTSLNTSCLEPKRLF